MNQKPSLPRGVAQALKPGGRFVAEFGGKGNVRLIVAATQRALQQIGAELIESPWFFPSIGEYAGFLEKAGLEVTDATLFDRPTPLEGAEGMRNWIEMFGGHFLNRVPIGQREGFVQLVEGELRPTLCRDGA